MLRASKTYKGGSPQGSGPSPLEGVAEALRGALLLREWPHRPFSPTGHLVLVYVYWNTETSTADLAGRDPRHFTITFVFWAMMSIDI